MRNRKAQVGIGTLIIFIAMILVAAVAAGVLLRTSGSLQTKATATGEQATEEVSTSLTVGDVVIHCDTADSNVTLVALTTKLSAGSSEVNYADIIAAWQSGDTYTSGIGYNGTLEKSGQTELANFGVYVLKGNDDSVLEAGEIVEVWLQLNDSSDIGEDTDFQVTLTPEAGQSVTVKKTTPKSITQARYVL